MSETKTTPQEIFNSIVNNAVDFLYQSVLDLEKSPKYSLINFYSAVELFLKARLMLEHWSLIYAEPQNAHLDKFLSGDLTTVGLDETKRRLINIAGIQIGTREFQAFDELRRERNKVIHFFNPKYANKSDIQTRQNVIVKQCKAWFYLHIVLTQRWRNEFREYLHIIEQLHKLIHKQQGFLQGRFEDKSVDIEKGKKRGATFTTCRLCTFEANLVKQTVLEKIVETKCIVCEESSRHIVIPCPNCGNACKYEFGEGKCDKCETEIKINYLLDIFSDNLEEVELAYCGECQYIDVPTVIPYKNQWLCLFCLVLEVYGPSKCGWCGELSTGEVGNYHTPGCIMCAIHIVRDAGGDDSEVVLAYRDRSDIDKELILSMIEQELREM